MGSYNFKSVSLAKKLLEICRTEKLKIATAESCTGGLVAASITEIPGSSDIFERGFITYSNEAKMELLGVSKALIKKYGAVSEQAAKAMARGALKNSNADIAVAITGIAGPSGGTIKKPVGLVFIAAARGKIVNVNIYYLKGNREKVRKKATLSALKMLIKAAK